MKRTQFGFALAALGLVGLGVCAFLLNSPRWLFWGAWIASVVSLAVGLFVLLLGILTPPQKRPTRPAVPGVVYGADGSVDQLPRRPLTADEVVRLEEAFQRDMARHRNRLERDEPPPL